MKNNRKLLIILILVCFFTTIFNAAVSNAAVSRMPRLNVRTLNITRASAYKLRVYNTRDSYRVSFESADSSIAGIAKPKGSSCRVKPKSSGSTTITAYVYDQDDKLVSTLTCKVIVSPNAASVKFNKKRYTLTEGAAKRIKAVIKPNISNEMPLYSSDNMAVATVSSNGTVTAISAGQTVIHDSISNGRSSSYTLTVTKAADNKPVASASPVSPSPQPSAASSTDKPQDGLSHSDNSKGKRDFTHFNYDPMSTPVVTCDE